jgi:mono/diheme cytochrome c family protein
MRRAVVMLALFGAAASCQAEGDRPGVIVLPGMHQSVPFDAYDDNPVTGPTLRRAPDGTVPHGAVRYHFGTGKAEAERAGRELNNPIAGSEGDLKQGKRAYDVFCAVCHGPAGQGDGPIIGRFPNPPSLLARAKTLPDGQLWHVITFGQGIMAPYAVQVPSDDRWRIVWYIRQLQGLEGPVLSDGGDAAGEGGAGGDDLAAGGAGGTEPGAGGAGGAGGAEATAAEAAEPAEPEAPADPPPGEVAPQPAAPVVPAPLPQPPVRQPAVPKPPLPKPPVAKPPLPRPPAPKPPAPKAPAGDPYDI